MGRLILVRHAQASFLSPDYDQLSPVGEQQARLLGEYWTRRKVAFDRVYFGPRVRQKDTAKIVGEFYRGAQVHFPEPAVMEEFDEFEGEAVLRQSLPRLLETDPTIRNLHGAFVASESASDKRRSFERLFAVVIGRWVSGEVVAPGVECWSEFCSRVHRGLSRLASEAGPNEQAAVFSSGGPIAVAMQRALNLSSQDTLRTAGMSRNCSYSEFLFSGDRFTLSVFNAFPHLDDAELLTYR